MTTNTHAKTFAVDHNHVHVLPVRNYIAVYVALLVLLIATVGAAFIDLGWFNFTLTMIIAVAKAVMILLIFMHVVLQRAAHLGLLDRRVPLARRSSSP